MIKPVTKFEKCESCGGERPRCIHYGEELLCERCWEIRKAELKLTEVTSHDANNPIKPLTLQQKISIANAMMQELAPQCAEASDTEIQEWTERYLQGYNFLRSICEKRKIKRTEQIVSALKAKADSQTASRINKDAAKLKPSTSSPTTKSPRMTRQERAIFNLKEALGNLGVDLDPSKLGIK